MGSSLCKLTQGLLLYGIIAVFPITQLFACP